MVLGRGDHLPGHHAQGGALGVVAPEHFLVVVVSSVGDAAAEGERLLTFVDLRSRRMSGGPSTATPAAASQSPKRDRGRLCCPWREAQFASPGTEAATNSRARSIGGLAAEPGQ